jgi:hypothetical protein
MSNHLIIGLGGTGGKVIREIRKAIYRDWRPTTVGEPRNGEAVTGIDKVAQATPPGLKVEYLYVDSSQEHMGPEDAEWKILGENIQLSPDGQCYLQGSDLRSRLADIHSYPALAPWIGNTQNWGPILNLGTGATETMGGQKRRLGRFLFAANAQTFINKVKRKAEHLREGSMDAGVQFHIISGLAGGTGSGSLIDTICLIRKEYPDSKRNPILLYLLLPEEHAKPNWDTGNYHANGYAALWELNALGVGKYLPYNLLGNGERFSDESLKGPFKICYLITNENSNGTPFDVAKGVPAMMAETLYQTLMAESMAKSIKRVVDWENMEVSHEGRGHDEKAERCRLFASFGIKKICYPEEEIREFIGYSLSSQTLLQMLYNHWAQGYLDEDAGVLAVEGLVADGVTQKTLNLDREVFFLERQFSTADVDKDQATWKTFDADWRAFIERLSADIVREEGNWLDTLMRRCEDRQKKSFRDGRGVLDYFSWKKDRILEYARLVASGIEDSLSGDLLQGKRSLTEIEAILRALCTTLEKKQKEWQNQMEENSSHAAKQRLLGVENTQRFEDLGPLARRMPGNKERIFEAGKNAIIAYTSLSTRVSAWEFAAEFVKSVRVELLRIADHVGKVVAGFRTAIAHCKEQAEERRPEERNLQSTDVVMRLFNGDEVTRYVTALIGNKEFQDKQARQARDRMVARLMHGRSSLRTLPTSEKRSELLDILAQSSHETLAEFDAAADATNEVERSFGRLLSVSIIDKLRERYEGNSELMRNEIRQHIAKSGYLLRINEAEHGKQGPGADFHNENKKTNLIVMLPDADKDDPFIKELKIAFQGSVGDPSEIQFVDTVGKKRYEITILSFVQLFPLRYAEVLGKLKEKYQARLQSGDGKQRILELHSEDPSEQFPPLFVPPVRDTAGPALLLGLALGTVRPKSRAGTTGTIRDELVCVDNQDDVIHDLGYGFEGAIAGCARREIFQELTKRNLFKASLLKGDLPKTEETRANIVKNSREIAGNDDDMRKMMRPLEEAAMTTLDVYLRSKSN